MKINRFLKKSKLSAVFLFYFISFPPLNASFGQYSVMSSNTIFESQFMHFYESNTKRMGLHELNFLNQQALSTNHNRVEQAFQVSLFAKINRQTGFRKDPWHSNSNFLNRRSGAPIWRESAGFISYKSFQPFETTKFLTLDKSLYNIQFAPMSEDDPEFPGDPGQMPVGEGLWILLVAAALYVVYKRRYFIFNLIQNS